MFKKRTAKLNFYSLFCYAYKVSIKIDCYKRKSNPEIRVSRNAIDLESPKWSWGWDTWPSRSLHIEEMWDSLSISGSKLPMVQFFDVNQEEALANDNNTSFAWLYTHHTVLWPRCIPDWRPSKGSLEWSELIFFVTWVLKLLQRTKRAQYFCYKFKMACELHFLWAKLNISKVHEFRVFMLALLIDLTVPKFRFHWW